MSAATPTTPYRLEGCKTYEELDSFCKGLEVNVSFLSGRKFEKDVAVPGAEKMHLVYTMNQIKHQFDKIEKESPPNEDAKIRCFTTIDDMNDDANYKLQNSHSITRIMTKIKQMVGNTLYKINTGFSKPSKLLDVHLDKAHVVEKNEYLLKRLTWFGSVLDILEKNKSLNDNLTVSNFKYLRNALEISSPHDLSSLTEVNDALDRFDRALTSLSQNLAVMDAIKRENPELHHNLTSYQSRRLIE